MKITLIGAGSFVFAPTVLRDAIAKHRLDGAELVLVDLDHGAVETMAGVGRAMAHDVGVDIAISATVDRERALPGADFVVLSASPQGHRRWAMDSEILGRNGLVHQSRECGGLGGLSNALRSITLATDVAHDMERLCPSAALLDVTNPMPRVVTAVDHYTDIACYGFCSVAWGSPDGYRRVARWVNREPGDIDVVTAGLNHFAWLVSVRDRATGENLMPLARQAVRDDDSHEGRSLCRWLDEYGAIGVAGSHHMGEYLAMADGGSFSERPPYHGDDRERRERWDLLQAVAGGAAGWRSLFAMGSWEHPVDVAAALARGNDLSVDMINLPNRGCLPALPDGCIVEVPACVADGTVAGCAGIALPDCVAELCHRVSDVHELIAEGAVKGERELLIRAIEVDPAIPEDDTGAALTALSEMLDVHADMLPQFA